MIRATFITSILCASTIAGAWPWTPAQLPAPEPEPDPTPDPAPEPEPEPPKPVPPGPPAISDELLDRLDTLDERTKKLEATGRAGDSTKREVEKLGWLSHYITAYIDVGAFATAGNGAGIRSDFLHQNYPQYRNSIAGQWVFMGDPFSTTVNTVGEPADTADSREVENDTINSSGRPTMLVNSLGLGIGKWVTDEIAINAQALMLPRPGPDVLKISYAFVEYKPFQERLLFFDAGKIDSVLGVEYRNQDAPKRTEITPSLIARYTSGRPIGISARLIQSLVATDDEGKQYEQGQFSGSLAVIAGDNFEERFEPDTEARSNKVPTIAGHLQWKFPLAQGLELGVSGAIGPQDKQSNLGVHQWHYGFDLKLTDLHGWDVVAEYVQGHQQGSTTGDPALDRMAGIERPACDVADCLRYKGAYVLVDHRFNERVTPYVRLDWRDATHRRGADFIYEANSVRATVGVNVRATSRVHAKLEYITNRELYVPNFPHDVITSSLVVSTD